MNLNESCLSLPSRSFYGPQVDSHHLSYLLPQFSLLQISHRATCSCTRYFTSASTSHHQFLSIQARASLPMTTTTSRNMQTNSQWQPKPMSFKPFSSKAQPQRKATAHHGILKPKPTEKADSKNSRTHRKAPGTSLSEKAVKKRPYRQPKQRAKAKHPIIMDLIGMPMDRPMVFF